MKIILSVLATFMLITIGCVTASKVDYPSYRLNDMAYESLSQEKSVYVAPIDQLSVRIGNFMEVYEVVQSEIELYLQKNGYNVLSSEKCEGTFIYNMSKVGGFFNQQTGKMDMKLLEKCINNTIADLKINSEFSAVVFPFLVFSPLSLKKPYLRGTWDGVTRKVKRNTTSGMSFSPVRTMSIELLVMSNDGEWVFESVGGIDFIQKVREVGSVSDRGVGLVTKEAEDFSLEHIREGIEIAFHPFIFSQKIGAAKEKS